MVTLIYDRTAADVERWRVLRDKGWSGMSEKERQEWLGEIVPTPAASKGMYTHNDLNRVERAVGAILELIRSAGYKPPELNIKTDWTYQDALWRGDIDRYYSNVETLRSFLAVFPSTPNVPSADTPLDYRLANDIEKILADVNSIFANMVQSRYYTGEIYSGEV